MKKQKLGWLHHRSSSDSVETQLHNIHRCSVDVIKRLTSTDKITDSESFSVVIFLILVGKCTLICKYASLFASWLIFDCSP